MTSTGYVFNHEGRSFDPNGCAPTMTQEQADAHNAALGQAEVDWIKTRLPDRCVGYLSRGGPVVDGVTLHRITTWGSASFTESVRALTGRRWNPFGGRWDTVIRGHAHVRATDGRLACYTFSGDYGMLTRLRRVKPCRKETTR